MIMPSPRLIYAALAVRDPEHVSAVFEGMLGLPRRSLACDPGDAVPMFSLGETALAVFGLAHPCLGEVGGPGLHHLGLSIAQPAAWIAALGLNASDPGKDCELAGSRQIALDPRETFGIRLRVSDLSLGPSTASGPVERIDHIGVACVGNDRAIDLLSGRMGFPVESRQTDLEVRIAVESFTSDRYGAVYHSRQPVPVGGLRVAFVTVGDCELELLENFDPSQKGEVDAGRAGTTRQDQGAIARFIERHGPGLHHLALKTRDIDATLGRLEAAGLRLIDRTGRPGSRRARIGFVHPASLGGVLLHFVERTELGPA